MGKLMCMRCRSTMDPELGFCPNCGPTRVSEEDPGPIAAEREFLVKCALEFSRPENPQFLGYGEEELDWKSQRVPSLPLGGKARALDSQDSPDKLIKKLLAGEAWRRGMAAVQLARTRKPNVVLALLKQLGDPESDVRVCALWSLGHVGDGLVLGPLLAFLGVEKDVVVRAQAAATLYRLVARPGRANRPSKKAAKEIEELDSEDLWNNEETLIKRGRVWLSQRMFLKALGDFSRCVKLGGDEAPKGLMYRSQTFLLMGKPLFALDDLILCPDDFPYPAIYYLHKATLVALAKQIVSTAEKRGLDDYGRLFERRLESLKSEE